MRLGLSNLRKLSSYHIVIEPQIIRLKLEFLCQFFVVRAFKSLGDNRQRILLF